MIRSSVDCVSESVWKRGWYGAAYAVRVEETGIKEIKEYPEDN